MQGGQRRAAAETKMNQYSSRSHAIFQLKLTQIDVLRGTERRSTLNLVDLAGSEKLKQSGSTEERQKEAANINLSLTTLRRVIDILIENSKNKNPKNWKRPPYRESMLTYVLSDSLGGNAKAMMLATVSPYFNNIEDTLHTLQHAYGSRSIICSAKVNEEQSIKVLDSMREEIFALRAKIECSEGLCSVNTSNITADDTSVEVDDHKRETICALERELMVEKKEKENMVCEAALCQRNVVTQMLRNAFLLLIHKKRQEADKQTIDELMCKNQELEKDLIIAEDEIDSINQEFTAHVSLAGSRIKALKEEAATRDAAQADAQQQLRDLSDLRKENSSLKSQNEALTSSVRTLSTAKGELEAKLVRLHEEMLAATGAMDRERQSRRESEAKHAAEIQKMTEALESIRQRKDKYKLSLMEAKAEACAAQDTVDAIKGERELFITALQAKQSAAKRDTYTPRSVAEAGHDGGYC